MEKKNEETEKQIDAINKQIETQMHFAYNDTIRVALDNCDYEFIGKLYAEIRDSLCNFVKKDGKTYNKIHGDFDVDFLKELMKNKQLSNDHLHGIVHMTFGWVLKMQAPFRDSETEAAKQRVLLGIDGEDIVPAYINEVHSCLNNIEHDIQELVENRDNIIVKRMLNKALECKGIKK
tara:strand:- start:569 stop:1099 length:531 start_codon:yes stop_codon:yes gene_type:complete